MNHRGITLQGLLVGVAVMGIVVAGGASLIQIQSGNSRLITGRSDLFALKSALIRLVQNTDTCICQLNGAGLTFDARPAAPVPRSLVLPRLRDGCALTDPVLAEANLRVGDGLFVDRVEMTNIVPTGNPNEWRGLWRISFRPQPDVPALRPVELHQYFYADAASVASNPAAARIASCRAPVTPGLINSCPPGYVLVGGPSTFSAYCIHRVEQPDARFLDAKQACASDRPAGFSPAHMCTRNEWTLACQNGVDPTFTNGNLEWFPDNDESVAAVIDDGACNPPPGNSMWRSYGGGTAQTHNYRCCIR